MKLFILILLIAIFNISCGCFFPCYFPGQGVGYNYFGITPGMGCVVVEKENGRAIECGPPPTQQSEENEDGEKDEENYIF